MLCLINITYQSSTNFNLSLKETATTELKTEMKSVSDAISEAVTKLKAEAEAKTESANAANLKYAMTSLLAKRSNWKKCANENGNCRCTGTVKFGARGKFNFKNSNGSIKCGNKNFKDPIRGVRKACYCKKRKITKRPAAKRPKGKAPKRSNWKKCANENGNCRCTGTVKFGARGKFNFKNSNGSIKCGNKNFKDPIRGVRKACYCKKRKITKGKAPKRPRGKAPKRPRGKGRKPKKPSAAKRGKGKGKLPKRPRGKGKALKRPKGKGKLPKRPRGKGRKSAAKRAKKAPKIKKQLKKLGKKMKNRMSKTLKFMKGKYKFNLKTGKKFCQSKCSNNKKGKYGICFKKGVKKCKTCSFNGNKKTKKGRESQELCSIVCRSINNQKCDFYAWTDDKKKVINKRLLNRFGRIFVTKFLQLNR